MIKDLRQIYKIQKVTLSVGHAVKCDTCNFFSVSSKIESLNCIFSSQTNT